MANFQGKEEPHQETDGIKHRYGAKARTPDEGGIQLGKEPAYYGLLSR